MGCADVSDDSDQPPPLGFWATRFMELFNYCPRSRILVSQTYQDAEGDAEHFIKEMCTRGLSIGHANFLFDMLESVVVDIDSMEALE